MSNDLDTTQNTDTLQDWDTGQGQSSLPPGTVIPDLLNADIVQRLISSLPSSWFSDTAKSPGGVLHSILDSWAANHKYVLSGIQYVAALTRIATATGAGLNTVAKDLLGPTFIRLPGETDASYRARIQFTVLQPRVTRQAIQNAILAATGVTPRMTEPWNPGDTSAYDEGSFWGVDILSNPGRWGSDLAYQGMIDIATPLVELTGGQPVYGYDSGAAFNQYNTAYFGITSIPSKGFIALAEQLTQQFKLFGTLIWMRFLLSTSNFIVGSLTYSAGSNGTQLTDTAAQGILQSFVNDFAIIIELPPYNVQTWLKQASYNFSVGFQGTGPSGQLGWYVSPLYVQGFMKAVVLPGQSTVKLTFPVGIPGNTTPACIATWNTQISVLSIDINSITLAVSDCPQGGIIHFGFLPGANQTTIPAGTTSITVNTPASTTTPYAVFGMPGWNTTVSINNKTANSFQVLFGSPAPTASTLYWTLIEGIL